MKKILNLFALVTILSMLAFGQYYPAPIQVYSGNDLAGPCNPFAMANPTPPNQYNMSTGHYFVCSITASGATPTTPLWASSTAPSGVTGTGNVVLATSPTLTTPSLGTPSAIVLTNATGLPPALVHLNVQKNLTLTDLQALNSVPYQVLAPPGATSMYQMGSCTLNLTRGAAAFTGGGTVSIGYDTTSSPATNGTIASTVFTTFAASHGVVVLPVAVAVTATTGLANKGIYITAASADFAVGTGATGQLNCDYSIVTGVQ
jgi:hypothetical protein